MMIRTEQEAADILKISVRTLQRWRREGQGPNYTRLGVRRLGYSEDDLQAWARRNVYASRAAELAGRRVVTKAA
jgi:predicted site-specific integrase-resolvase